MDQTLVSDPSWIWNDQVDNVGAAVRDSFRATKNLGLLANGEGEESFVWEVS